MAKSIMTIDASGYKGEGIISDWKFPKYPMGFYYDHELNNPLTRITLHANKKYNEANKTKIDGPWDTPVPEPDDDGYSYIPIATSIFAEDFSFDIANTFSDFGGDPIGELWNSQAATAPYAQLVGDALKTIAAKTVDWNDQKQGKTGKRVGWADTIADIADFMGDAAGKNAKYHARALHVNGTQFAYYAGSGISFNNMSMKFTLLSDWENGVFKTVIDKLLTNDGWPLLAYVIGDYIPVTEIGGGDVKEFISKYASWQLPPGGFRANLKNVDVINEGTLKLRFGPYFSIANLIISGCSISMSKEMMRNPGGSPEIVPMSCDVTLQFKPAANFSKVTLEKILKGETDYVKEVISQKKFSNVQ